MYSLISVYSYLIPKQPPSINIYVVCFLYEPHSSLTSSTTGSEAVKHKFLNMTCL